MLFGEGAERVCWLIGLIADAEKGCKAHAIWLGETYLGKKLGCICSLRSRDATFLSRKLILTKTWRSFLGLTTPGVNAK